MSHEQTSKLGWISLFLLLLFPKFESYSSFGWLQWIIHTSQHHPPSFLGSKNRSAIFSENWGTKSTKSNKVTPYVILKAWTPACDCNPRKNTSSDLSRSMFPRMWDVMICNDQIDNLPWISFTMLHPEALEVLKANKTMILGSCL